jgi:CHAT domain-containing protein
MDEVQRSMRMGAGSTVVLSACNSGRGKIRAEGVVDPARGFLFAGATATVVSLWGVHDGSSAALKKQMYKHLEDGRTTAQALGIAMLHLLRGPAESWRDSRWRRDSRLVIVPRGRRRPLYWAVFLVLGANTHLPGV